MYRQQRQFNHLSQSSESAGNDVAARNSSKLRHSHCNCHSGVARASLLAHEPLVNLWALQRCCIFERRVSPDTQVGCVILQGELLYGQAAELRQCKWTGRWECLCVASQLRR